MDKNDTLNFEFIKNLIKQNDVLVDIGANEGEYTDFFKNVLNGTGKIYSVELYPSTYQGLVNKYENNTNIIVLNNAVCDKDEPIEYFEGVNSQTNNIIGHDMNFKSNSKVGMIDGLRLDTLLKNEDKIKLIKIDVEGAELRVLKGMVGIIDKVDGILLECHLDEDWDDIRDILLNQFNLSCFNILDKVDITNNSKRGYQCFCKQK